MSCHISLYLDHESVKRENKTVNDVEKDHDYDAFYSDENESVDPFAVSQPPPLSKNGRLLGSVSPL